MPFTLSEALRRTEQELGSGVENVQLEAGFLVEHVAGLNRAQQQLRADISLSEQQLERLNQLTRRRRRGEPLAYVLGTQPFWTLDLSVSPNVLIPRPETELLVERALRRLPSNRSCQIADLGTGSGAIALALASERPEWTLWATDVSSAALAVATENAQRLKLTNIHFAQGSWCEALGPQRFELIASNPPYIAEGDPHLEAAVLEYEPRLALLSGADGLDAIRRIVTDAPRHLKREGWLLLEHGWQQAGPVRLLLESAGFVGVASHADLAGHLRVTEGQWLK